MKKTLLPLCLIALFFCACNSGGKSGGNKYSAVFQKHEPRISEIRKFLSGLTNALPDAGTATVVIKDPSPALKLGSNDSAGNLLILQYHMLATPEIMTSYDSCFGLYYNPLALDAFKWSGITKDRLLFEKDYLKDEDVDKILSPLNAERFPWLLIVKANSFEPLEKNGGAEFAGGSAAASYYLFDLRSKKQVSSITLSAAPDKEMLVAYQLKKGEAGKNEEEKRKAKETMEKNMRAKVYEWLTAVFNKNATVPAH